ncbi:MAG: putative manganese transporter [Bacteroidales bacterium]
MFLNTLFISLKSALVITGMVMVMMILIEYVNVSTAGKLTKDLQKSKPRQVVIASLLGLFPGCMGGFATVALYQHKLLSFGALIAMMIATSGDEAFVMLSLIPGKTLILFAILFVISVLVGLFIDKFFHGKDSCPKCDQEFLVHNIDNTVISVENHHTHHTNKSVPSIFKISTYKNLHNISKEKIYIILGLIIFIALIVVTIINSSVEEQPISSLIGETKLPPAIFQDIFNEKWIQILFITTAILSILFTFTASKHFIKEHIWGHVIKKHFLTTILWTLGAILVIKFGIKYLDAETLIRNNMLVVIILSTLIGIIPESGPNLIIILLFINGDLPFSVLLANSISQDGHAALALLAYNRRTFINAKLINVIIGAAVGIFVYYIFGI